MSYLITWTHLDRTVLWMRPYWIVLRRFWHVSLSRHHSLPETKTPLCLGTQVPCNPARIRRREKLASAQLSLPVLARLYIYIKRFFLLGRPCESWRGREWTNNEWPSLAPKGGCWGGLAPSKVITEAVRGCRHRRGRPVGLAWHSSAKNFLIYHGFSPLTNDLTL